MLKFVFENVVILVYLVIMEDLRKSGIKLKYRLV